MNAPSWNLVPQDTDRRRYLPSKRFTAKTTIFTKKLRLQTAVELSLRNEFTYTIGSILFWRQVYGWPPVMATIIWRHLTLRTSDRYGTFKEIGSFLSYPKGSEGQFVASPHYFLNHRSTTVHEYRTTLSRSTFGTAAALLLKPQSRSRIKLLAFSDLFLLMRWHQVFFTRILALAWSTWACI
jgi:hypothetical protein